VSDPTPYTAEEWAPVAEALSGHRPWSSVAVDGALLARIVATVDAERARVDRAEAALALAMDAAESVSAAAASMNRAVNQASVVLDPRCRGTLGRRPDWMSPDQYDPCRCDLTTGHDGPHECEHTRADASPTEGNPDE